MKSESTVLGVEGATVGDKESYRRILKVTSLLGGAQMVNMAVSLLRGKLTALFIGPSGVGLMGAYLGIANQMSAMLNCGLAFSGVKELAEARGSGDEPRYGASARTLHRLVQILALAGGLVLVLGAWPISSAMFGDQQKAGEVALLSLVVMAGIIAIYYTAVVQASGDMVKVTVASLSGTVLGAAGALVCFGSLGAKGIMPAMILGALVQTACAWWAARSETVPLGSFDKRTAVSLLKLGSSLVGITIISSFSANLLRRQLLEGCGPEAVGWHQAAATIAQLSVTYILAAMGTDLLPRLSEVNADSSLMGRIMNDQTSVAMYLGLPGTLAVLFCAPYIIPLLFSGAFLPAASVLQLSLVSVLFRLLAFPLGFALMATKHNVIMLVAECVALCVQFAVVWLLLPTWGVLAAAAGIGVMSALHTCLLYSCCARWISFRWSGVVWRQVFMATGAMLMAWALVRLPQDAWTLSFSVLLTAGLGMWSIRGLAAGAGATHAGVLRKFRGLWSRWFTGESKEETP